MVKTEQMEMQVEAMMKVHMFHVLGNCVKKRVTAEELGRTGMQISVGSYYPGQTDFPRKAHPRPRKSLIKQSQDHGRTTKLQDGYRGWSGTRRVIGVRMKEHRLKMTTMKSSWRMQTQSKP